MLSDFVQVLPVRSRRGPQDAEVRSATGDSRQVRPGSLFAAIPGTRVDGHRFIRQASLSGARVVLLKDWPTDEDWPEDVVGLQVDDPRRAMAIVAHVLEGQPSRALKVFGITGTNGKTTTVGILGSILEAAGLASGSIGTTGIEWSADGKRVHHAATHTTPEGPALHAWLGSMRDAGVEAVSLELSSHALEQGRAAGLELDVAAWSNLSRDHLDYHGSLASYEAAKARILGEWLGSWGKPGCSAVLNVDDPVVRRHAATWPRTLRVSCSPAEDAELRPTAPAVFSIEGCSAELASPAGPLALRSRLLGPHNFANCLLAAGCALAAGLEPAAIEEGLSRATGAPGRLERVEREDGEGPLVLVDYAHSPDALERVLEGLRPLVPGRLVTVFGCGGDRDAGKRPLMARAAAAGSDFVVLTSDNPRSEDPAAILDEAEAGLDSGVSYLRIRDRAEAIAQAVASARPDDVVLVAGKGHETWQELAEGRVPFDDRLHAARALEARP